MTASTQNLEHLPFVKAHGIGNDFIVVDAVAQVIDLNANQVARLCERHKGLGADGLLRIAPASEFGVSDAKFFMDYRNADGSIAETCGNGLRVFARMLIELGYENFGVFAIGTRAGTVTAMVYAQDEHFKILPSAWDNLASTTAMSESMSQLRTERIPEFRFLCQIRIASALLITSLPLVI